MTRANNNGYTDEDLKVINDIKRFMLENEFKLTTVEVLDAFAKLVYKSTISYNMIAKAAYKELAATGTNHESYRLKLSYHGKNNYKNVKNNIYKNYGYIMDDEFMGVKNFVEQLAIVYSTYANHY